MKKNPTDLLDPLSRATNAKPHRQGLYSKFLKGCATVQPKWQQKQILVQGECEGLPANFFVSIISTSFVDSLIRQTSAFKIRDTTVTLSSLTSDTIKTYGEIDVLITVTNTSVKC